jgi:parallel beta-helix repeat protein
MREEHAASVGLAVPARSHWSRTCQLAGLLLLLCVGAPLQAATYSGTVFEDANFGGGVGRSRIASGGTGVANARVEIFRVSDDQYLGATTTSGTGAYTLTTSGGDAGVAIRIRVVNATVRSARTGGAACTTCVPVQTFRTNVTIVSGNNVVSGVTDRVGGENPALSDATAGANNNDWDDLPVAGLRTAQSFTTITPASAAAVITDIDFGFNFSLVVNTRDPASCTVANSSNPCQGSLRQFITNANALGGQGALSQSGSGQIDGSNNSLPGGFESSIFMIPEGLANPGQPASFASQLTGGVAVITLTSALPAVTSNNVRLDATTQTVNIGNTNAGTLGSVATTVGVDAISLPSLPRPEVQLTAGSTTVQLSGNSSAILGFALRQGFILLSGTGCLARHNAVGMTATGDSSDNSTAAHGITFQGSNSTVRNNFVTVNNSGIRTDSGGANSLITLNEVARPTSGHSATYDGILLVGTVSGITVSNNLTRDQAGGGIEVGFGGGASASLINVTNNTVRGNGVTVVGSTTPSTEPLGMAAYAYSGNSVVFSRNIIRDNGGAGIMLMNVNNTQVTQNSFSNNGGLSIDLDTRSIDPNGLNTVQGVTLNDNGDADTGPNGLDNYPVMVNAVLAGGELSLGGFARPGATIELYIAQADPTGFGEGLTYLGTLTEGSAGDLDSGTGTYGPGNINGVAQGTDTTNRFSFRIPVPGGVALGTRLASTATILGETSEFSGNVLVTAGPNLALVKSVQSFSDPVNGTTNPKSFPGATKTYVVTVTNQGAGSVDSNTVMVSDPIPSNTKLFVGNLGGPGSGPVAFVNGTPSSALTWTFSGLANLTDDLEFSNDGGTTWTYVPVADGQGCDAAVTHIRMRPKGVMPGNGSGNPSFQLQFRVLVN